MVQEQKFNGLNPYQEEILTILASEATELAHSVTKILLHGPDSVNPNTGFSNLEDTLKEYSDTVAAFKLAEKILPISGDLLGTLEEKVESKVRKIPLFLHHAPGQIKGVAIKVGETVFKLRRPYRHHHVIAYMCNLHGVDREIDVWTALGVDPIEKGMDSQGFYTDDKDFLTRQEAWVVAEEKGQIIPSQMNITPGTLFSEHLW